MKSDDLEAVVAAIERTGLVPRGALSLMDDERDGSLADIRTIVLAGMAGRDGWSAFAASPEASDGLDDPLDRWSRRVIEALARELGGESVVPLWRPAFLAVPAMGAARRTRTSLADRNSDPSALWALAFLSRRARLPRSVRHSRAHGRPESMRILLRTLVLENVSRRRVLRRRLRRRRLRGPPPKRCGWGLHGRGMSGAAGVPGRRRTRLRTRAGEFHHARVPQGALGYALRTEVKLNQSDGPQSAGRSSGIPFQRTGHSQAIVARSDSPEL